MGKKWCTFISLVGFIGLMACQKEGPVPVQPEKEESVIKHYELKVEKHNENHLDHLGIQHYRVLDHLVNKDCIDTTEKTRYQVVEDYLLDTLDGQHSLIFADAEKEYEDYLGDTAGNREELLDLNKDYFKDYLFNNAKLDSNVQYYYVEMKKTL